MTEEFQLTPPHCDSCLHGRAGEVGCRRYVPHLDTFEGCWNYHKVGAVLGFEPLSPDNIIELIKAIEEVCRAVREAFLQLVEAIRECFKNVNSQEWPALDLSMFQREPKQNRPRFRPERSIRPTALGFTHRPIRGMVGGYR